MQTIILDANAILRHILNDIVEQANEVEDILRNHRVLVLPEVIAEVIYVLAKYYNLPKDVSTHSLLEFLDDANYSLGIINNALVTFNNNNLDFVDCLLYEYSKLPGYKILTFDKDLLRLINKDTGEV